MIRPTALLAGLLLLLAPLLPVAAPEALVDADWLAKHIDDEDRIVLGAHDQPRLKRRTSS